LNIREKLFSNLGWKIAAVFLALVLWFHVATEKVYEKTFSANIQVVGLRKDLQVEKIEPPDASVSIVATGKQILQLMLSGGTKAYIDLSFVSRPGQYEYSVNLSNLYDVDPSAYHNLTFISGNQFTITIKTGS
jgi:YbbR domain-containing protein